MQLRALAASLLSSTFQLLAGLVVVAATVPPALLVLPPLACFYFKLQRDYRCSATEAQRLQSISRSPVLQQVKERTNIQDAYHSCLKKTHRNEIRTFLFPLGFRAHHGPYHSSSFSLRCGGEDQHDHFD